MKIEYWDGRDNPFRVATLAYSSWLRGG